VIVLRPRLGLGIGRRRVSAMLIDGSAVKWAASRLRSDGESLADSVRALLAACPRSRLRPPIVVVAVGPAAAQLKLVADLPPLTEPAAIAALVREQASRFFLKNGIPLLYSGARPASPTTAWVAAFEEPVVRDVIGACRDVGLTVDLVTPTAVVLQFVTGAPTIAWQDDDVELTISYANGAPARIRSSVGGQDTKALPDLAPLFEPIADRAADLLDAAGATRVSRREPIALRGATVRLTAGPSRRRLAASLGICGAAIIVAMSAPLLASARVERAAHASDAAVHARVRGTERDAKELGAVTAALGTLASFTQSRRSCTLLLAQLTRALPDGSVLLALQVDSGGTGSIAALGPHAAAVVDAVERVPGLAAPEIVGPVTRETVAGKALDRVTIRFHLVPDGAR